MNPTSPSPTAAPANSELFRAAFRFHPAGIAVVTATTPAGRVGLTASSVASVSMEPPVLAFSVSGGRSGLQLLEASTVLVHLMGADQMDLVRAFATPGAPRFTGEWDWQDLPSGEPLLHGAPWALRCGITHQMPVGGSVLVAATVLEILGGTEDVNPLVYHDRTFHRLSQQSRIG